MNSFISLLPDCVQISGEFFTVANGYTKKVNDIVYLPFGDLLKAEIVKRRNKRFLYMSLLIMGISVVIITPFLYILGYVFTGGFWHTLFYMDFYGDYIFGIILPIIVVVFLAFSVLAVPIFIIYLLTGKTYVELTTMKGIFRVEMGINDTETLNHIEQRLM